MAEIQGHLTRIGDDFDTALVSKLIGRLPTYVREKTEVLGNGQLFGHCEWGVETALMEAEDFQPVSDSLREMLDCPAELLKKLLTIATQNGVFCTMWSHDSAGWVMVLCRSSLVALVRKRMRVVWLKDRYLLSFNADAP